MTGLVYGFAGFCSGPLLGAVLTVAAGAGKSALRRLVATRLRHRHGRPVVFPSRPLGSLQPRGPPMAARCNSPRRSPAHSYDQCHVGRPLHLAGRALHHVPGEHRPPLNDFTNPGACFSCPCICSSGCRPSAWPSPTGCGCWRRLPSASRWVYIVTAMAARCRHENCRLSMRSCRGFFQSRAIAGLERIIL